jgi:hypothetical protein
MAADQIYDVAVISVFSVVSLEAWLGFQRCDALFSALNCGSRNIRGVSFSV